MNQRTKQLVAALFTLALTGLVLLSASLSDIQLNGAAPFPGASGTQSAGAPLIALPPIVASGGLPVFEAILAVALVALLLTVPARLIKVVNLRRLLWLIAGLAALIGLLSVLPRVPAGGAAVPPVDPGALSTPVASTYTVTPLGRPPVSFLWLAAAALLAGAVLLAVSLWRQGSTSRDTGKSLARHAERALRDLQDGADFPDTVIRCYLQMTALLQRARQVERESSMTAHEFESWLEARGIPGEPLRNLTYLFEKARYSEEAISDRDEQLGIRSLNQIVQYCGSGASGDA